MLYILSGQDDYSLSESLGEIKKSAGNPELLATNTTTLDGQKITLDQLKAVCETLPFLADNRLVIVEGLLERFESGRRSARRKKATTGSTNQNGYEPLASYISKLPESTILVLVSGKITNSNPLLRRLSNQAEVKSFPLLRGIRLRQWIQEQVRKENSTISLQAIDLLAKMVGSNLRTMSNEIDKLTQFATGHRIEEEDVKMVVSYAQQDSVFTMVDAILESKAGLAEQSLHQLLQRGTSPAYLLVMLARQVRMIVHLKELRNQRGTEAETRNKLGLTADFAWRKTLEQAQRYPLQRIKKVYHQLLETDLSIKTGKYENELALNILIAELCQRGRI